MFMTQIMASVKKAQAGASWNLQETSLGWPMKDKLLIKQKDIDNNSGIQTVKSVSFMKGRLRCRNICNPIAIIRTFPNKTQARSARAKGSKKAKKTSGIGTQPSRISVDQ